MQVAEDLYFPLVLVSASWQHKYVGIEADRHMTEVIDGTGEGSKLELHLSS